MGKIEQATLFEISFNKADGYVVTEREILVDALTNNGHFSSDLRYSAFRADRVAFARRTGTYRLPGNSDSNIVYCCHVGKDAERKLSVVTYDPEMDLPFYLRDTAKGQRHAAFAVYDLNGLEELALEEYRFRFPDRRLDTLKAVYRIKDYWKR